MTQPLSRQSKSAKKTRSSPSSSVKKFDLAIVGMGVSGLYTAWRLSNAKDHERLFGMPLKRLNIALFDTMPSDRVGGRLCTQPLPGYPFLAELGGMRFRSNQLLVNGLIGALGLADDVQRFSFDQHFYFLREQRLLESEFSDSSRLDSVYRLRDGEKGVLPHSLIESAIQTILSSLTFGPAWFACWERATWGINIDEVKKKIRTVEGVRALTLREWAVIQRYGEYRNANFLSDVGFWDLLQFQLSSAGWHLANDGLGYESVMGNWNAGIALPWFIHDFATPEFKTLKNGMKSIASRLYEALAKEDNIAMHHRYDLATIDLSEDGPGLKSTIRLQFDEDGNPEPQIVFARSVVLALPKGALVRLKYGDSLVAKASVPKGAPPGFDRRLWFSDLLHSVDSRALFKLFLGYSSPWWTRTKWWRAAKKRTPSMSISGKVNTDLPLRQVYYYGKNHWNQSRKELLGASVDNNQCAMIMASYSDSHYIEFWNELRTDRRFRYRNFKNSRSLSGKDEQVHEEFGAPLAMILRAEHQLGILHGRRVSKSAGEPLAEVGLYMEWSRPPYYGGWHSWKVGIKPWEVCNNVMRPFGESEVFICGEAYSTEQGWVEGALKSAERLLTLMFDLSLPPDVLESTFGGDFRRFLDYIDALDYRRADPQTGKLAVEYQRTARRSRGQTRGHRDRGE